MNSGIAFECFVQCADNPRVEARIMCFVGGRGGALDRALPGEPGAASAFGRWRDDALPERPHFRRQERRAVCALQRSGARQQDRDDLGTAHRGRSPGGHAHHRWRRPHADAGPDRHALACDAGTADARGSACQRRRLHQPAGGRRGHRHADARLHHRPRHGRPELRPETRHRRGHVAGAAHLSVRRDDHDHQRSRRFPPARPICRGPSAGCSAASSSSAEA